MDHDSIGSHSIITLSSQTTTKLHILFRPRVPRHESQTQSRSRASRDQISVGPVGQDFCSVISPGMILLAEVIMSECLLGCSPDCAARFAIKSPLTGLKPLAWPSSANSTRSAPVAVFSTGATPPLREKNYSTLFGVNKYHPITSWVFDHLKISLNSLVVWPEFKILPVGHLVGGVATFPQLPSESTGGACCVTRLELAPGVASFPQDGGSVFSTSPTIRKGLANNLFTRASAPRSELPNRWLLWAFSASFN